jgi:hypothetical protein
MDISYSVLIETNPAENRSLLFDVADLSPNLAKLSANHRVTWVVDEGIFTDDAELIMDFRQIAKSGLVSVSVRAGSWGAAALTNAYVNDERHDLFIYATRTTGGLRVAALALRSAKILDLFPLWDVSRKYLLNVANIDATGQLWNVWDLRPGHRLLFGDLPPLV